ncbi:estradiol 17-beta-dehydrogenase 8-like [Panonychus citri]|uniref:estradiol 17-beta-dehydrogenase 8-like n=1 Tax=Panonychus citri TaxID=50023 RepID=UPI002307162C|nr:estradiol 17-beta-dehydrogenase 8-like [Panonychus citri]
MLGSTVIKRCLSENFAGRVALVTGAGGGIGRAVSLMLAEKGSSVVSVDINEDQAAETRKHCESFPGNHASRSVDVSSKESVTKLFSFIKENYSTPPSILINCAGIIRDSFLLEMSEEDFDSVINVNLKGTFLTTQAAVDAMVAGKVEEGSIINLSSVSGKIGNIGQCNYASAKHGIESFTRVIAKEVAKHNIRCNCIMPGFINTQILAPVPQKVMDKIIPQIPLKRIGKPEEIAEAVCFLSSPRASYITGITLQISGGLFM